MYNCDYNCDIGVVGNRKTSEGLKSRAREPACFLTAQFPNRNS